MPLIIKNQGFVNNIYDMICISQHTRIRYFSHRRTEKTQMSLHKPTVMLEPLLCTYTKYESRWRHRQKNWTSCINAHEYLTPCLLGNFACFCRLLIFFKWNFSKNYFRNTIRVSNSLDSDQAGCFVGPDLGPNCLQSLSAAYSTHIWDKYQNFMGWLVW